MTTTHWFLFIRQYKDFPLPVRWITGYEDDCQSNAEDRAPKPTDRLKRRYLGTDDARAEHLNRLLIQKHRLEICNPDLSPHK